MRNITEDDEELFLKRTPTSDRLLADSELRYPYEGSKTLMHVFDRFEEIVMDPIRKAEEKDVSRIAEILVFTKRMKYRSIFQDDDYSFGELQVLPVAKKYIEDGIIDQMFVYDDGIVKGLVHIEENEIIELYVDYFFQNHGIGSELIKFAKEQFHVTFLWAIEKNTDAIHFYERHGFHLTDTKKYEEGTTEYLVMMTR